MLKGCSLIVFRQALHFSDYHSLKCKNTYYFLGPHNSPLDTDPVLVKGGLGSVEGMEGIWTTLGASFLQSHPSAQHYFLGFKVEDEASGITYATTPIPRGLKEKEEPYPLSVQ